MDHFEGEHFTGLARWLTVPNSTITLWMCPKSQIDGQNHKKTGIRRKIFHKRPSRRADLGTLRMDDHWPVRNVFYERLRCWHLAWDSKLLSWQFDKTLPEAQRTQGIASKLELSLQLMVAPLALVPNLATRWRHLHELKYWPLDGTTCISC